jgi:hypothetical protein
MRVNRFMLIVGLVFAVVGGGALFVMNTAFAPAPSLVVAAREDIPSGTRLIDIPDDLLVLVPLQLKSSAQPILQSLLKPDELEIMRASGGVLIQDVLKFEPILLSAIVAKQNPAAARLTRLGMDDPNMMLVVISTRGTAPESISSGDRVDLAVAVDQVRDPVVMDQTEYMPAPPGTGGFISPVNASPEELLEELAQGSGIDLPPLEETPTATPTPTSLPNIREPLAKVLIHGAPVVRVIRERTVSSFTSAGDTTVELGDVIGLEVIIPRDAFELITMASSAGILQIGLLSPLAEGELDGPTMGASLQDLLDLFYADRAALAPTPTPTVVATMNTATTNPTATPTMTTSPTP